MERTFLRDIERLMRKPVPVVAEHPFAGRSQHSQHAPRHHEPQRGHAPRHHQGGRRNEDRRDQAPPKQQQQAQFGQGRPVFKPQRPAPKRPLW
jgi:ATP-dependent RNA helicase RhlE